MLLEDVPRFFVSDIDCGRTKAGYVIRLAIAPLVIEKMIQETAGSVFVLHVDESTHHRKVRLEYWIVHHVEGTRKVRYLVTKELKTDLYTLVYEELCKLNDNEITEVTTQWNKFDEFLLKKLLIRFRKFLSSTAVRKVPPSSCLRRKF